MSSGCGYQQRLFLFRLLEVLHGPAPPWGDAAPGSLFWRKRMDMEVWAGKRLSFPAAGVTCALCFASFSSSVLCYLQ